MFFNWSGLAPPPAPPARRHGELVAFGEEPTFSLSTGASLLRGRHHTRVPNTSLALQLLAQGPATPWCTCTALSTS